MKIIHLNFMFFCDKKKLLKWCKVGITFTTFHFLLFRDVSFKTPTKKSSNNHQKENPEKHLSSSKEKLTQIKVKLIVQTPLGRRH